jgi:hypothetical protein
MKEPIDLFTDCYLPDKPFPALRKEVTRAVKALKPFWQGLELHRPRIAYAKDTDGCGCYCNGSMDYPVIILDVESFNDFNDNCIDLYCAVHSTIVHELIHAYLETIGMHCTDYEHPEEDVEQFTRDYCDGILNMKALTKALDRLADSAMVGEK